MKYIELALLLVFILVLSGCCESNMSPIEAAAYCSDMAELCLPADEIADAQYACEMAWYQDYATADELIALGDSYCD